MEEQEQAVVVLKERKRCVLQFGHCVLRRRWIHFKHDEENFECSNATTPPSSGNKMHGKTVCYLKTINFTTDTPGLHGEGQMGRKCIKKVDEMAQILKRI